MAADPRQFTEHNEVGGANVYYEDKRMEELKSAAPKTDSQISTTDEYIPLQDTDGNLVKINPASFQEAVRNVLGGLLANNDKGVTISGIPALSGSGASLDFGSVTPANLASVLGGIISGGDLYDSGYSGTSVFSVANQTIFPDVGELYGTLLTIANNKTSNYTVLQIFFTASVGRVYYRVKQGGAFLDWHEIGG